MTDTLEPFEVRAERLLNRVFRGLHHCPKIKKQGGDFPWWEINPYGDLATYDLDTLTRLVIAAHDECVRAEISSSGPRRVRVLLHPRYGREGDFSKRHPTIEQAILNYRNYARPNEYAKVDAAPHDGSGG